jgi:phosphoglycerate dehydrogenase-like enzyme
MEKRRPRVLVLASDALFRMFFPPPTERRLRRLCDYERSRAAGDSPQLRARLARADALVTTWHSPFLTAEMLAGSRVRAIVHCGGELASHMEAAVLDRVTVANTPEPMAVPVAEMALALLLALVRRLPEHTAAMRRGASPDNAAATAGETLAGRRIGLVGFGRVGRAFARLVAPFGVELSVYDPHVSASTVRALGGRRLALDPLLSRSSAVVLVAALTAETRALLDRHRLALLPDGAFVVNVARGALVDFDALVAELRRGRIRAALDVTDPVEPLPRRHVLRRLPNVLLTPHVAAGGIEVRRAMGIACVEELGRVIRHRPPRQRVTRGELARMT